jgi:pimeloyl-ACP methyl ester carboxylesterase
MPRPTPRPNKRTRPNATEDIDPRWLIKAGGITVLVALLCGYLTLCWLFSQGQWQLVLHPTRTATSQPPIAGSELIHFAPDETATPQLTGWSIPATPGTRYTQTTILFLPSGDGSLADNTHLLATLHDLGLNIFAIDYRGYGQSAATHPSQQRMTEDTESAYRYLTVSLHLKTTQIVPYGIGVGASLAAQLAATHTEIPAIILESPHADLLDTIRHDPRSNLLPTSLLFHEDFPLANPLSTLHTPKLLLSSGQESPAFKTAADPKITVDLNPASPQPKAQAARTESITRFLDQYLSAAQPTPLLLTPTQK